MLFAMCMWKSLLDVGFDPLSTHVLNGGRAAWDENDGCVDLETVCPLKAYTPFYEVGVDDADADGMLPSSEKGVRHVDADGLREFLQGSFSSMAEDTVILGARSEAQYSGRERRGRRAGHIPRSVPVPYKSLRGPRGIGFADDDTLARRLYDAGLLALDSGAQKAVVS
jgi:3-mercaptopyruvate sulfurtransferase SseA